MVAWVSDIIGAFPVDCYHTEGWIGTNEHGIDIGNNTKTVSY